MARTPTLDSLREALQLLDSDTEPRVAGAFLQECESTPNADFLLIKHVRCIVAAIHLRRGQARRATAVMQHAYRGARGRSYGLWEEVYDRCRAVVPDLERVQQELLERDKKLPRYYRTGLDPSDAMVPDRARYVVFDSQALRLLKARDFVTQLFPNLVCVDPSPSLIESLPLASAAFGQANSETGYPFWEDVDWVAAADPVSGEGAGVQQDSDHVGWQFLAGTPLSQVRRSMAGFLAEVREHDPREQWYCNSRRNDFSGKRMRPPAAQPPSSRRSSRRRRRA